MPEAHEPRELLARRHCPLAGADDLGVGFGGKYLPARLVELVHRAGLLEMTRELRRGFRIRLSFAECRRDLACCDRADISAPRLGCDPQGLLRSAKLGLRKFIGGDPGARRHGQQRQQAADHFALDVELDRGGNIREGETQGRGPARLDRERFRDPEPVICRL